ncbi:MAG: acyl-CoA desaturase [Proteobacteria bacterium]|nr:acyl-CoA desaturase [Pseudomonadota bacterium]
MATPAESPTPPADPVQTPEPVAEDGFWAGQFWLPRILYWGIHAACLLVFFVATTPGVIALALATFWLRMFGITGGYHRYFAHKGYRTSRVFQFVLAFLGCSATQKGPLWWAGNHRNHHRYADGPDDPHSPRAGFWHAHNGWIFEGQWDDTPVDRIRDFAAYPEIRWLNRWHMVPPLALAVLCYAIGGFAGLVWGYAVSTTLLWHSTYTINSLAHRFGSRRYDTPDDSRNNLWLALLTLGEGWHNNHHHYQASARNGFFWWEVDVTYYALKGLEKLGLVWDLRQPPKWALSGQNRIHQAPERSPSA